MNKLVRYPGEHISVLVSIIVALFVAYVVFELSSTLLLLLVLLQLVFILFNQKQIQGNSIRISESQFKKIDGQIKKISRAYDMRVPDSFIMFSPYINAFVMGFKRPYTLVLTSTLVEAMDEDELQFIIGHELGHIKLQHSRLKSIVYPVDRNIPVITFLFNFWLRKTEYSCDRAGLIASGQPKKCISALLKLTVGAEVYKQVNTGEMVDQIETAYDERVERISELFLTHPYVTNRVKQIIEYYHKLRRDINS